MSQQNNWGDRPTEFFFSLTPDRIFDAIEARYPVRCTGYLQPLNSMENRVYEIEIEPNESFPELHLITKFYRPGRWSPEQIQEEHSFLWELNEHEIPAIAPIKGNDDQTLMTDETSGIHFCVFPKQKGRPPDELNDSDFEMIGRMLARVHRVGATRTAENRVTLNHESFGRKNLQTLLDLDVIPPDLVESISLPVKQICEYADPIFSRVKNQRIHGDCHLGNLISYRGIFFWVDFDDMLNGPPVQDLWLLLPGRDEYAKRKLDILLNAYTMMNDFDDSSLKLIEVLRALRMVHFAAWTAKRWDDPAFKRAFPQFADRRYFETLASDLREQLSFL